jgi:hypothetical protein
MTEYGDGRKAPPAGLPRESIELQRAGGRIALGVRARIPDGYWLNIEADVSPNLMRLVFHYGKLAPTGERGSEETIELDLISGHPIDDSVWLSTLTADVLELIASGASDLIIPHPIDYVRLCGISGETLHEEGRHLRPDGSFRHTKG